MGKYKDALLFFGCIAIVIFSLGVIVCCSETPNRQTYQELRTERLQHEEQGRINREAIQRSEAVERAIISENLR
jgi:hypothetical protein